MSNKGYNVSVIFDLHGISCPGVWLCPKGKILVKLSLFGVSEITKEVNPSFPLRFNERFHFNKSFKPSKTKNELFTRLRRSIIKMQLIQQPPATTDTVVLGVFCSPITEVLYPCPNITSDETSADVDLLFCPCKIFPGILAPKAEVSTKIQIQDSETVPIGSKMNPTTIPSLICDKRLTEGEKIIRQKGVCHTKYNYDCKCFLPKCEEIKAPNANKKSSVRPHKSKNKPKSANIPKRIVLEDCCEKLLERCTDDADQGNNYDTNKEKVCADIIAKCNKHRQTSNKRHSNHGENNKPKFTQQAKKVASYDGLPKKSEYPNDKEQKKGQRICSCCGNEPKVKFRNFMPSQRRGEQREQRDLSDRDKENKIHEDHYEIKIHGNQHENKIHEEGKEPGCEVCNCSICLKYEAYFIHRAIEHKRGNVDQRQQQNSQDYHPKSVSSESSQSDTPSPDLTPNKCFCFKDKKDNNLDKQKRTTALQDKHNSVDKCFACKCPLPQSFDSNQRPDTNQRNLQSDYSSEKYNNDFLSPILSSGNVSQGPGTYQRNLQSDYSSEKCNICQCPLPTFPVTIQKYNVDDQCDQLREQFYKNLDEYYGEMKKSTIKRKSGPQPKKNNQIKKPSSRLLNHPQNNHWGYKKTNNNGPGYWDINAADWNRIQL